MTSNKYLLPLDAIDMNFLPITYARDFSKTIPLLDFGTQGNEYFEFEIRKTKEEEEPEILKTRPCYICNLDIPKGFLNVHYNSKKHLRNKNITVTALERISKHIQESEICDIDNDDNNLYLCPDCNCIVQVRERKSHEMLQSHKNSVMLDKMLSEFISIYVSNNEACGDENEWCESAPSNIYNNNSNSDKDSFLNEASISNGNEIPNEEFSIKNKEVLRELYTPDKQYLIKPKQSSDDTNNVSNKSMKTKEQPNTCNNTKNNMLSKEFISLGDNMVYCTTCNSELHHDTANSHVEGRRHKMNLISDVHYMMVESGDQLYCMVCSVSFTNTILSAQEHCNNINHKLSYDKKLTENGIHFKSGTLYCELCQTDIPYKNEFCHISKSGHAKRRMKVIDKYFCDVCNEFILQDLEKVHKKSLEHKMKINSSTTINGEQQSNKIVHFVKPNENPLVPKNPSYFCNVCQVQVPNNSLNISSHNNGAPHQKKLQQAMVSVTPQPSTLTNSREQDNPENKQNESKKEAKITQVCERSITNTKASIYQHSQSQTHLNNYNKALEKENIVMKKQKYFCIMCEQYVTDPLKHVDEKRHVHLKTSAERENMLHQKLAVSQNDNCDVWRAPNSPTNKATGNSNVHISNANLKSISQKPSTDQEQIVTKDKQTFFPNKRSSSLSTSRRSLFHEISVFNVTKSTQKSLNIYFHGQ